MSNGKCKNLIVNDEGVLEAAYLFPFGAFRCPEGMLFICGVGFVASSVFWGWFCVKTTSPLALRV